VIKLNIPHHTSNISIHCPFSSLVDTLLQIYCWLCRLKNFENRSTFEQVKEPGSQAYFLHEPVKMVIAYHLYFIPFIFPKRLTYFTWYLNGAECKSETGCRLYSSTGYKYSGTVRCSCYFPTETALFMLLTDLLWPAAGRSCNRWLRLYDAAFRRQATMQNWTVIMKPQTFEHSTAWHGRLDNADTGHNYMPSGQNLDLMWLWVKAARSESASVWAGLSPAIYTPILTLTLL